MPQPAKIATLPADVRQELHLRVIHSGFRDYKDHSEWLKSQGHDISHTAVWRYFRQVRAETERRLMAMTLASVDAGLLAAHARQSGEDFSLAAEGLLQQARYDKLRNQLEQGELSMGEMQEHEELERGQRLTRLRAERERELQSKAQRAAAESPPPSDSRDRAEAARRQGLSPEGAAQIRARIQGPA